MSKSKGSLAVVSVWALAAGGMVGGGIYTVLGVVIAVSAQWAWLAFLLTGFIAIPSAYSYVFLTNKYHEEGGAFTFLSEVSTQTIAGNLSWLLILGYVLTISVYAYAFGHYVSFAFHGGPLLTRILAAGIIVGLILLNLAGVGKLTKLEIVIVSVNLLALLVLGIYGLTQWDSVELVSGIQPRPAWYGLIGGGAIFMAYEGFQLLTYEYDKIKNAKKTFMPTMMSAVIFVVVLYMIVAIGAAMTAGGGTLIHFKQIAMSIAAQAAFGKAGLIGMTIAAGFATAAAINSTLFSTANLSKRIAGDNELPQWFAHTNQNDIPDRSIILLGILAGILAVAGSLSSLVEAASLAFIFTFGTVNFIAMKESPSQKWLPITGFVMALVIGLALLARLVITKPVAVSAIGLIMLLIVLGRPFLLQLSGNSTSKSNTDEEN